MFRFLCKKLLLFSPNSPKAAPGKELRLSSLFPDLTARTLGTRASSSSRSRKSPTTLPGLSSISALSASKEKVGLQSSECSDLAQILANYGLSRTDALAILTKHSEVLLAISEKTIKTKLDFFQGAGFTGDDIADILGVNPYILKRSVEKGLVPSVDFLRSIFTSSKDIVKVLKSTNQLLTSKREHNIQILKSHNVPDLNILNLILLHPRALARNADDFNAVVENVKELGLDPARRTFVIAVGVMSYMAKSTRLRKVKIFKEFDWSDEEISGMFKRQPCCIGQSDVVTRRKMRIFVDTIGWDSTFLSTNPVILLMSIEKRIIPRCSVLNILMSRGLIKRNTRSPSLFMVSEKNFFDTFVEKYKEVTPEVVEAYQGKIGFKGWDWLMDTKGQSDVQSL